jgi:Fe-S cluster assembly iron-binding protein IscA
MAKQQEELMAGRTSAEKSVASQRQMRTLLQTVLDERERRIPNSQMRNRDEDGEDDAAAVAERIKAEMAAHGLSATAGKRRRGETPESESSDDTQMPKLKKPKNGDVPEETSNPKVHIELENSISIRGLTIDFQAVKISSRARLKLQNITLSTTAGSSLKLPSKTPAATS